MRLIPKKSFSTGKAASIILEEIESAKRFDTWISTTELVDLTGLPRRDCEAGMLRLAAESGGHVDQPDNELRLKVANGAIIPLALTVPSKHFGLAHFFWRAWRSFRGLLLGSINTTVFGLICFFYASLLGQAVGSFPILLVVIMPLVLAALCASFVVLYALAILLIPPTLVIGVATGALPFDTVFGSLFGYALFLFAFPLFEKARLRIAEILEPTTRRFFNFGRPPKKKLELEKRFTSILKKYDGRVTRWHLSKYLGWDYTTSMRELTRLMVDYGGDVGVDDDGTILFDFSETSQFDYKNNEPDIEPYSAWYRPPNVYFDRGARNADILGWVVWALAIVPIWLGNLTTTGSNLSGLIFVLASVWPLFSIIRRLLVYFRQRNAAREIEWTSFLKTVDLKNGNLSSEDIEKAPTEFILALDGVLDENENDEFVLSFPEVAVQPSKPNSSMHTIANS